MEYTDAIRSRRMVRRYLDTPVAPQVLERIIEAGRRAPNAGNTRGTHFIVAQDAETRSGIARAADEDAWAAKGLPRWLGSAPVHIVIVADRSAYDRRYSATDKNSSKARADTGSWTVPWWWVDAGAALMAILTAAVDEGLGAGFLGGHALDDIEGTLGVPDQAKVVGVVTIGTPHPEDRAVGSSLSGPAPADDVVHYERWDST